MTYLFKKFASDLGRDFWLYRFGQIISIIGDGCSGIAVSWWILDETGSAAKMASIFVPYMFITIILGPFLGPLGDRFSRKSLIAIGDTIRFIITFLLALIAFFKLFNLPLVIALYSVLAIGTSLFAAGSSGITPKLVTNDKLPTAMRKAQTMNSFGSIIGGVVGGIIVTLIGVSGAMAIDALSYLIAAIVTMMIKANTKATAIVADEQSTLGLSLTPKDFPLKIWFNDLVEGFKTVKKIPLEYGFGIFFGVISFVLSPIGIILPVLVKETRNMPPWFLGALESGISIGSIIGAIFLAQALKKFKTDIVVIIGIISMGLGLALLPWTPNIALPVIMMLLVGVGSMFANIPLGTQITMARPDYMRSRLGTATGFIASIASPIGMSVSGVAISTFGIYWPLCICGLLVILFSPLIYLIPKYKELMRSTPEETANFYLKNYPEVFKKI